MSSKDDNEKEEGSLPEIHNEDSTFESEETKLQKDRQKRDRLRNRLEVELFFYYAVVKSLFRDIIGIIQRSSSNYTIPLSKTLLSTIFTTSFSEQIPKKTSKKREQNDSKSLIRFSTALNYAQKSSSDLQRILKFLISQLNQQLIG